MRWILLCFKILSLKYDKCKILLKLIVWRLITLNNTNILLKLNAKIFQEEIRILTFESLLKYIQINNIKDIDIIIDLLVNDINGSIEDMKEYKNELDNLLK